VEDLKILFSVDSDFDVNLFRRQVAVIKGQVYNLVQVLKRQESAAVASAASAVTTVSQAAPPQQQSSQPNGFNSTSSSPVPADPMNPLLPANTTATPVNNGLLTAPQPVQQPPRSPLSGLIGSKVPSTSSSPVVPPLHRGTPIELINEPPCLIWEDEDVRDLAAGVFGPELTGKGLLGTIIGGMETLSLAVMGNEGRDCSHSPVRNSTGNGSGGGRLVPDEDSYGEFLTSPAAMVNGVPVYENFPLQVSNQRRGRTRTATIRGAAAPGGSTGKLDAFKGRVITFVKNQPWLKSW
jgi:hypothetical protein